MFELSLHILDLIQNSVSAGASLVVLSIYIDSRSDQIVIVITDDGCGMDEALLARVTSPFATTRKTRKVGLGIPMFKQLAEMCQGHFKIESTVGAGTRLEASFRLSHVDLPPMGNLTETIIALVLGSPEKPDFRLEYRLDGQSFDFDTREIRQALGGLALSEPDIVLWMKEYLNEAFREAREGALQQTQTHSEV